MEHDDRRYRVYIEYWSGDIIDDTIKFSCGGHLADVVDLVQGDSSRDVTVEAWTDQECTIKEDKK